MATPSRHLRVVRTSSAIGQGAGPERGDLAFIAVLFGVNLVPVLGAVLRIGQWGSGTVGLAMVGGVVTGCELWLQIRAAQRARR